MKNHLPLSCVLAGGAGAIAILLFQPLLSPAIAETKLLPFQGRLTDALGKVAADGAKVVEFKMYDAPTGGSVKWAGEIHKLSINGGLVNTILGSKASLGSVDFSTPTYLQITIDANSDDQITAADPPLLPRQSVVPAIYASEAGNARNAAKLAGSDWTSILADGGSDPNSGFIAGGKIKEKTIPGGVLIPGTVGRDQMISGAIGREQLSAGAVGNDQIESGSVGPEKLAGGINGSSLLLPESVTLNELKFVGVQNPASAGNVAYHTVDSVSTASTSWKETGLSITLTTTGRPVVIMIGPGPGTESSPGGRLHIHPTTAASVDDLGADIKLSRDGQVVSVFSFGLGTSTNLFPLDSAGGFTTTVSLSYVEKPPAGPHIYTVQFRTSELDNTCDLNRIRINAYEIK